MKKLIGSLLLIFLFFSFSTSPAFAAAPFVEWGDCVDKVQVPDPNDPNAPPTISEVPTLRCLPVVFQNVVSAFLIFVGVIAIFMIIYSGIKLVLSGGDPKQVEAARKIMNYAIIGAIVVLSSFAILFFIAYITQSSECITKFDLITKGGCK